MTVPRISSAAIWVAGSAIGGAAVTVIGFRIIGEVVGAAALGHAVLLYGVTLLIASVGAGPTAQALGKYYFDDNDPVERRRLLWSGLSIVFVSLMVGLGALVLLTLVGVVPGFAAAIALAVALAMEMLRTIVSTWLQSQERFAPVAIAHLTDVTLRPVIVVILSSSTMPRVVLVLLAYALAAFLTIGAETFYGLRGMQWVPPSRRGVRRVLSFGAPLLGNSIFGWLSNTGDRYLIAAAMDVKAAGIYIAASALGGRLSLLLGNTLETYYRPPLYAAISACDKLAVRRACQHWVLRLGVIGALMLTALLVAMPLIQEVLLAPEFRDGAASVITLSFVAYWIVALGFIAQRINYAHERTGYVAATEVGGTLLMAVSVFALSSVYGLVGAAAGMVVAALGRLLLASYLASRSLRLARRQ